MNIKDTSTEKLREMRDMYYSSHAPYDGPFSMSDILNELAEREKHVKTDRIPCWDTDPHTENAFL